MEWKRTRLFWGDFVDKFCNNECDFVYETCPQKKQAHVPDDVHGARDAGDRQRQRVLGPRGHHHHGVQPGAYLRPPSRRPEPHSPSPSFRAAPTLRVRCHTTAA